MRTFLKNLERFRAATLLNLLGLTVAYAAALVIILQVNAEYMVDTKYPDGDRLYRLEYIDSETWQSSEWNYVLSRPSIEVLKTASPEIEEVAFAGGWLGSALKVQGEPIEKSGFHSSVTGIDSGFVRLFDMQLVEGTTFDGDKSKVLIPLSMARERFAGASAVGQKLDILDAHTIKELTVAGVYRDFPSWSTLRNNIYYRVGEEYLTEWGNYHFRCFVKLRAGADTARLVADLNRVLNEASRSAERSDKATYRLQSMPDAYFSPDYGDTPTGNQTKLNLFALVAFLIVAIGAINYANFATALVPVRIRNINTRKVYGATNAQLRRGLLAEALGLSVGAYLLAALGVCALDSLDGVSFISLKVVPAEYLDLIGYGTVWAVVVGLLAGLFPALYSTSIPAVVALKGSFGLSPRGKVLRTTLVGFQFVVSVVLIATALVMNIQYRYVQSRDLGFERQYVLNVSATTELDKARTALTAQLEQLPEVSELTYSDYVLAGVASTYGQKLRGEVIFYGVTKVASNFAPFYGLKIIEGSGFTEADDARGSQTTMIFNRTAQKKYNIEVGDSVGIGRVVGIVADFHAASLHEAIEPFALLNYGNPADDHWRFELHLKVRTADLPALTKKIEAVCRGIDPNYMGKIKMLDSRIKELYASDERATTMITWFGAAAILVSLFGVFGLVHFEIAARRKEIGLRKINGATISSVLSIFVKRFAWLVVGACAVGIPVAWWAVQQLLEPFAYKAPIGWWVYAVAGVLVLLVVVATVVLQTLEAARANPIKYIRNE